MDKIKTYTLNKVIAWLLGGELFNQIKSIVAALMDSEMPSEQKREIAYRRAKKAAQGVASFMINLAIEAAVFILKAQQGDVKK